MNITLETQPNCRAVIRFSCYNITAKMSTVSKVNIKISAFIKHNFVAFCFSVKRMRCFINFTIVSFNFYNPCRQNLIFIFPYEHLT